jgi:Uncharacterized conserved protein
MKSIVSIRKTEGNGYDEIKTAVDAVIKDIGGLEDVIRPGYHVIIKPNMVTVPTSRLSGAVTRWEVSLAVYEAVKSCGGIPVIAESASVGSDTEAVIKFCGYDKLIDKGIPVIDLKGKWKNGKPADAGMPCSIIVPEAKVTHKILTWELVRDADAIITIPVMKTHDQAEITLGMKNLKGLMRDSGKKLFHRYGLVESIVDLNTVLKPCLEIVDGTFGQEGLGPVLGDTKEMDLIIGSKDVVACESVTGLIMGYDPEEVPVTKAAAARGLGNMNIDEIEVKGEKVNNVKCRFIRSHETKIEGVSDSFKMVFDEGACTGCRNTVVSALMDMKNAGLLKYTEDLIIAAGPVSDENIEGLDHSQIVCVGACAKQLAEKYNLRYAEGCSPRNPVVVKTILNGREEY